MGLNDDPLKDLTRYAKKAERFPRKLHRLGRATGSRPPQRRDKNTEGSYVGCLVFIVVGLIALAAFNSDLRTGAIIIAVILTLLILDHYQKAGKRTPRRPERQPISKAVQREVWRRDGGRCVECGSQENLEFDHIIPLSKGGGNTARNIQLLCQTCNRRKSSKDPGDD